MFEKLKLEVNFFTKVKALAELDKDTLVNVIGIISEKSDIKDLPKKSNNQNQVINVIIFDDSKYAVSLAFWNEAVSFFYLIILITHKI